ncbi:MAG TPA: hypothetical protein VNC50_12320 [Planctomycetia bacterium]|nr:hypothetical protein [Planctomycetia bacterium]
MIRGLLIVLAFVPLLLPRGTCLCNLLHGAPATAGESSPETPACCQTTPVVPELPALPFRDSCPDHHCVHCESLSDYTLVKPALDAKQTPAPTPFPAPAAASFLEAGGPVVAAPERGFHPSGPPRYLAFQSLRR